jgi:DnaJ-class molecular chaperone
MRDGASEQAGRAGQKERASGDHGGPHIEYALLIIANATLCVRENHLWESIMANEKGPNVKKKQKCKNCEGKGLLKKGDKVVKCQRCGGTGLR